MRSTKSSGSVGFGLLLMFFLLAVPAMAQERPDFPSEDNRNPYELSQTLDSHGTNVREHRDSLTVKPVMVIAKPKSPDATKSKTQEEPLSFNFLYYIIQKFKGSDVVN